MYKLMTSKKNKDKAADGKKKYLFWHTLNGIDFSDIVKNTDYKNLPKGFHKFFDGRVKDNIEPVWCDDEHIKEFK